MTTFGIGASVKRREDQRLLTGEGRFADDFNGLGQAHAAFVRSPHAHADVLAIDAAPGKAVAGVLAVFTGHDLAAGGAGGIPTVTAERGGNLRRRDGSPFAEPTWLALATARVRHVGEPIAMVVATTPAQARDGAEAVVVRYAARPAVVDAVAALGDGAPQLHAVATRNRVYDWECGDAAATERAFASAAHVARLTLVDNRLITCFMEPRAALAAWDAATGRYTIHASLQSVHQLAANLARILGVARDRVRCITGDVGGGFGSKIQPYPEYVALAWAARRVGRPLKWVSSRSEGFVTDAQSRDHRLAGEMALDESGRITALRRANMVRTFPYRTATGAVYDSGDYVARLDEAVERADGKGFPARRAEAARRGKLRGIGLGPYVEGTGGVPQEFAEVRVLPAGVVEVPMGSQSQGQGHETVFAQVVAERLGVPFEAVSIVMGDTDRVAKGVGTFASRSMVRGGSAAVEATEIVVATGKPMAAHLLEAG